MSVFVIEWTDVCAVDDLLVGRGCGAYVNGRQLAIFRTGENEVYAISNRDPFSGAFVLSRGIVGSRGDVPKVASPMYKQSFDLRTGVCLEDPTVAVETFEARVREGRVEVVSP